MKKLMILITLVLSGSCLGAQAATTEETTSINGSIGAGVMFINFADNLDPHGSEKVLPDLNTKAEKELTVLPYILPTLEYDVGEPGGDKLYLNTKPAIDEVGGFAVNIGGSHPLENAGVLDISAFFTPFDRAWKNPYLTEVGRESTSTTKYGAKVALNKILGTDLRMNVVYMNDDVDEDVIGKLEPDLARDGAVYALNANYSLFSSPTFELRPRLSIRKGEYDGESNSFTKGKVDLEARYTVDRLTLLPQIFYSHSTYDKINPIFAETRKNDGYGAMVMVSYATPFDMADWALQGLVGYSKGDSNIAFYDTESISAGIFLTYKM